MTCLFLFFGGWIASLIALISHLPFNDLVYDAPSVSYQTLHEIWMVSYELLWKACGFESHTPQF